MDKKLDLILNELREIKISIRKLKGETEEVKKSCNGMDNHIRFVDNVYSKLRSPLDWLTRKISGKTLPEPKNTSLLMNLIKEE